MSDPKRGRPPAGGERRKELPPYRTIENEVLASLNLQGGYINLEGSETCAYLRQQAKEKLPEKLRPYGLAISPEWWRVIEEADEADTFDYGKKGIRNFLVACIYAMTDAYNRATGATGIPAHTDFFSFFYTAKAEEWAKKHSDS